MPSTPQSLAILGAGPTGLDAALAAAERGRAFTLYEAAPHVAGAVQQWRHVRLFTPWSMSVSPRMRRALEAAGRSVPDDPVACPTGAELIEQVFAPIARLPQLRPQLRFGAQVKAIAREGYLKHEGIGDPARGARPLRLLLDDHTNQWTASADAVLDCTGATLANALGADGIPALGEDAAAAAGHIVRALPDIEAEAGNYAGRTTLLVGGGRSAQTAARSLAALARQHPGTELIWVLRGASEGVGDGDDPLPERARLTAEAHRLIHDTPPGVTVRRGLVIDGLVVTDRGLHCTLRPSMPDDQEAPTAEMLRVDRILSLTGHAPDFRIYRQLQVHECYATAGPMKLAAALLGASGGGGDCLDQTSLGAETLRNPEPNFYILGRKSYGRRSDYLMRVGWEQVDEVFSLLDGAVAA
ncbi:MAG: NAD(P)-binding protein [Acidobacteriota bacterium]